MPDIQVAISTVADGSMYDRHDATNQEVVRNRAVYLKSQGISMDQTTRLRFTYGGDDYCRYRTLDTSEQGNGMTDDNVTVADALVTTASGHALMLPVADCVGTVLYDPRQRVLMMAHLGRHSLEQIGGVKIVEFLTQQFGSRPADLRVWLTPAPNKDVYPIWALNNQGMKEAALEQLQSAGVLAENITDNPADTITDRDYFSYSEFLKGNRDVDGDHMIVAMMTK